MLLLQERVWHCAEGVFKGKGRQGCPCVSGAGGVGCCGAVCPHLVSVVGNMCVVFLGLEQWPVMIQNKHIRTYYLSISHAELYT